VKVVLGLLRIDEFELVASFERSDFSFAGGRTFSKVCVVLYDCVLSLSHSENEAKEQQIEAEKSLHDLFE
jgi:hypothetical protein